ncbi:MAG: prepilin peptidase [bacterium]
MNIILWTIFACVLGIAVGSFINVVVFRTGANEPITGRSKCRQCLVPVATLDLIPIWSYFALKGRCRKCSSVIEWQYPAVELAMGILFGLLFARAALGFGLPIFVAGGEWVTLFVRDALVAVFLVIIFVYDLRYSYILDRFSIPAMIIVLLFNIFLGTDAMNILAGGFLLGGFFAFQFLISGGKWIGGGDIRMGLLMGFLLGIELGIVALFLSYVLGAIAGIILITTKKYKLDSHVPFGTFMAGATIITMIWGQYLLDWYMGFFG